MTFSPNASLLPDLGNLFRRASRKNLLRSGFAVVIIGLCFYFVRREGGELLQAAGQIRHSPWQWAVLSLLVSLVYLLLCAGIYMAGFAAAGSRVSLADALRLFLKRNVVSVFLPAGGLSSLAFFNRSLTKRGISASHQYVASAVYTVASFGSLVLLALPMLVLLAFRGTLTGGIVAAFGGLAALVGVSVWGWTSYNRQGLAFRLLNPYAPAEAGGPAIQLPMVGLALLLSVGVEVCGITHLWLALRAISVEAGLEVALFGYVIATLLYAGSPFMRGLGVVELSLTYALIQYGVAELPAISVTLYYRFFEFWLPLLLGLAAFLARKDNLVLRVLPAFLVLVLGLINVISGLTPALTPRVVLLSEFLSTDAMRLSNAIVIGLGIGLVFLSLYLIRGLRNAWWLTVFITALSVVGHLTKAIDYEEALFGCVVLAVLVYTRSNYRLASPRSRSLVRRSVVGLLVGVKLIYIYGLVTLLLLKSGPSFAFWPTVAQLNRLLTLQTTGFLPDTHQAHLFVASLQWLELLWLAALAYVFVWPVLRGELADEGHRDRAKDLIARYGHSSLDYFKSYGDKRFFFHPEQPGFMAYRSAGRYAVALEGPVAADETVAVDTIRRFDQHCRQRGLQTLYYRVNEADLARYGSLGKKHIFIGQEGRISLADFSLEGPARKALRNILRKLQTTGYVTRINQPPLKDGLLQKLQAVSDEWLREPGKQEAGFTQGVFNPAEIKQQVVVTMEDPEEKVVAFANIMPDYSPREGSYDLIRKTDDAPGGAMDALLVELISYGQSRGWQYLNLGMAPLSGIETPHNIPERGIKFAYEHLKQLSHFKGLRFFKDKYADQWDNKYLVYNQDIDLVQAPQVLVRVSRYEGIGRS